MAKEVQPIEVGDRFESKDRRDRFKVVEVVQANPTSRYTRKQYVIRTEVHESNPAAVGRKVWISDRILRTHYRKVSR